MEIKITYKGKNADGHIGYYCGFKPENVEILEEIPILCAAEGFNLLHKETKEEATSVVNGNMDDYIEIKRTDVEELP